MLTRPSLLGATLLVLVTACAGACAQDHGGPGAGGGGHGGQGGGQGGGDHGGPGGPGGGHAGPGAPGGGPGYRGAPGYGRGGPQFDGRYNHNHYYPGRGYISGVLPYGAVSVGFGGGNYFFQSGVWWRPYGGRYIVVTPPYGIYAPVLPPDYVTLYIGGAPYYYADGIYYSPAPGQGYQVVAPPPGADVAQPATPPTPPAPDPIFYPRNNQSPEQTEADRRDCNTWATSQPNAMADAKVFQRAAEACMDGRGYTVR